MPANIYECMFILDTNKVANDVPAAAQKLHAVLERNHAEVLASRPWGDDRKLAYTIKNHRKGLYYLTYFRTEGKNVVAIEHDFSLNEMVVRMMILRVDEKLVEPMLAVARDEHMAALPTVNEPPPEEGAAAGGGEEGGERGPRGRRPMAEVKED